MRFLTSAFLLFIAASFCGCHDKVDLPDQSVDQYTKVYMPQAVDNPVNYHFNPDDTTTAQIIYGADYGGAGYPDQDVDIRFGINAAAIDSFNTANNTDYALLPSNSYALEDSNIVIKKGALNTEPLKITIFTKGDNAPDPGKTYILPLYIKQASVNINEQLRTTFYVVSIRRDVSDYTDFDRANWTIADFDSQEPTGEGADNGHAVNAIDNNPNTYWHTQWQAAQPGLPHYIVVDMGESKFVHGIRFLDRQDQNDGKPQNVQVFLSDDNKNWQLVLTTELANTTALQQLLMDKFTSGRYVKVLVTSTYGAKFYTHLAELYLF